MMRNRRERGTPGVEHRGLDCPACGSVRVVTHHVRDGYRIRRRRRHCQRCGHVFQTVEIANELLEAIWRGAKPSGVPV